MDYAGQPLSHTGLRAGIAGAIGSNSSASTGIPVAQLHQVVHVHNANHTGMDPRHPVQQQYSGMPPQQYQALPAGSGNATRRPKLRTSEQIRGVDKYPWHVYACSLLGEDAARFWCHLVCITRPLHWRSRHRRVCSSQEMGRRTNADFEFAVAWSTAPDSQRVFLLIFKLPETRLGLLL
ncbi:hypothetical protein OH76DRAFT_659324 [Lentinus brumalis]|uniref:Uncharacterized protein n=1 Tax=Lentinus brumalis TaxID=2498619 RepID=A0A371D7P0_9APHY|nr:hypothetical protein OH76DRAFT_659324 [Polyporus brumalis]